MRTLFQGLVAALLAAPMAHAADDPFAAFYGNTLHETREVDGSQSWYQFNADKTFSAKGDKGPSMSGTYTWDPATSQACITIAGRPAGGRPACAHIPAAKVGEAWDQPGPTGKNEHYVLEAGRS